MEMVSNYGVADCTGHKFTAGVQNQTLEYMALGIPTIIMSIWH
jgi:hypothetical protein